MIDERTARDDTILFCARELVDAIQEAEIRVAWHEGSERDKALVRYLNEQESDEDVDSLVRDVHDIEDTDIQENGDSRTRLRKWISREQQQCTQKWAAFRLRPATAVSDITGIFHVGVHYALEQREDFDENGVLIH